MVETIIEIPASHEDDGWQPPVLTRIDCQHPKAAQRITDVFFIQYVTCVLLVLAVWMLGFCDSTLGNHVLHEFNTQSHAPSPPLVVQTVSLFESLWS